MAKDEGWGRRLRSARRAYEERHDGELTYKAIGERLGERLNRPAFKHSTVRAWFVDGQEPDSFAVARALEDVLEAPPGSLIIGETKAPPGEEGGEGGGSGAARPVVQPGPTAPTAKELAEFINKEREAARQYDTEHEGEEERPAGGPTERGAAKKAVGGTRGRGRRH